MKKLKNELRISKKAEQLAKDKLATVKKQLEKATQDLTKSKAEADSRIEGLKDENNLLQAQLQRSPASFADKQAQDSDVLKVLDSYSKQT